MNITNEYIETELKYTVIIAEHIKERKKYLFKHTELGEKFEITEKEIRELQEILSYRHIETFDNGEIIEHTYLINKLSIEDKYLKETFATIFTRQYIGHITYIFEKDYEQEFPQIYEIKYEDNIGSNLIIEFEVAQKIERFFRNTNQTLNITLKNRWINEQEAIRVAEEIKKIVEKKKTYLDLFIESFTLEDFINYEECDQECEEECEEGRLEEIKESDNKENH